MNNKITFDLTNFGGFAYITDTSGAIVKANKEFMEFLGLSESSLEGRKLKDCPLLDAYMLDQSNLSLIQGSCNYEEVHEIFKIQDSYQCLFMISHKRIIFLNELRVGLLNQSLPVDKTEQYQPKNVFNISNVQLGLKIKENMNALYGFKAHLDTMGGNVQQQSYMDSIKLILDKMRLTMDGIILSNDKYNNAQETVENIVYDSLYIGSHDYEPHTNFFSMARYQLEELLSNRKLLTQISEGAFAVLYLDRHVYKHLQHPDFQYVLDCSNFNTLLIVIDKEERLEENVICATPNILTEANKHDIYDMWRKHIKATVRNNIASSKQMFVLSIEDDPDSQDALCSLLERHPVVKVTKCSSGIAALDKIAKQYYDLIILDINLGDISGFQIAREIRIAQQRHGFITSLLYVNTGYDYTDKVDAKSLGIDAIYLKPYLIMDIEQIIKDLLFV
jgi:CheY-like chemotaxis protein